MKILKNLIFTGILFSLFLAFFQVSQILKDFYLIKKANGKITNLSLEVKNLEIELQTKKNFSHLEEFLAQNPFQKTSKIKFLEVLESEIVAR